MNPYQAYFCFNQAPFSISPNPNCWFMSQQHLNALKQLVTGLEDHNDGFVLLTGEVGTGKTTLCRRVVEDLGQNYRVAFLMHPFLEADTLLVTLAEAFGFHIDDNETPNQQLRRFTHWLNSEHQCQRQVIIVLDEAQNLHFDVLEALRLLTNIETHSQPHAQRLKPQQFQEPQQLQQSRLQIVLVGQPELLEVLNNPRLRQLNQRVTTRCHLSTLGYKDVAEYVRYRLYSAGGSQEVFTNSALKILAWISKGTPRVINLLCDQALVFACEKGVTQVGVLEILAAYQIRVKGRPMFFGKSSLHTTSTKLPFVIGQSSRYKSAYKLTFLGVSLFISLFMFLFFKVDDESTLNDNAIIALANDSNTVNTHQAQHGQPTSNVAEIPILAHTRLTNSDDVQDYLPLLSKFWNFPVKQGRCDALSQLGLRCWALQDSIETVLSLNLPALLSVEEAGTGTVWLLEKRQGDKAVLSNTQGETFERSVSQLTAHYQHQALVVWQPPSGYNAPLKRGQRRSWVPELRALLEEQSLRSSAEVNSDWEIIRPSSQSKASEVSDVQQYDWLLENEVKHFQQKNHLQVDGIVGPKTWIYLHNHQRIPTLTER